MHPWIDAEAKKTVVLLGAGASQPNVPLANQLTQLIKDSLDEELVHDNNVQALWRAIRPELDAIGNNVEYLYQAIETLSYQDIDPTRHWVTGFKKYGDYEDSDAGRAAFHQDAERLTHIVASRAYEIVDSSSKGAELSHFMPMLNAPLAGIISLNYDLLIEHAAAAGGVRVSTGAQEWDGGPRWRFPVDATPLLKLHGSVSWRFSRADIPHWGIPRIGIYEVEDARAAAPGNNRMDSKLIFGGGNKLRPDEPWPALYTAFEDMLAEAETLVVIGYSFSDPHVDAAIRRWAAQSGSRRIINIDPCPIEHPSCSSSIGHLRYALDPTCVTEEGIPSMRSTDGEARFDLIRQKAETGIPEIFGVNNGGD
ncbi:MAG: hypothetical protein D3X82_07155 [Candidatus Leucobacter sulfamidivorax]|nr:hypothetical protein [Candidatus Leucobacter sulfamidivorax]